MRLRAIPFRLLVIVFLIFLCYRISLAITYLFAVPHRTLELRKHAASYLLEKSVYLQENGTEPLTIFFASKEVNRVVVVISSSGYFQRRVFCRYFDKIHKEIGHPAPALVFPEFLVYCPHSEWAEYIGLTIDRRNEVTGLAKIFSSKVFKYDFSVCLAPIYGEDPKWLMLVEFIEFYKLQGRGAEHFYIYKQETGSLEDKILNYYEASSLVQIITINKSAGCLSRHRCRHEVQLQDCLTRSRRESKRVATVDLDERILPNRGMLRAFLNLQKTEGIGEYRFRCQWVLRYNDIPTDIPSTWEEIRTQIPTTLWHNTSHVAPFNHTTKSVIDPEKVESMGVHQVLRFKKDSMLFLVPPEVAVVRHYRLQRGWSFFLKEAESFGNFSTSSLDTKLQETLLKNVKMSLCDIFNKFC